MMARTKVKDSQIDGASVQDLRVWGFGLGLGPTRQGSINHRGQHIFSMNSSACSNKEPGGLKATCILNFASEGGGLDVALDFL